MLVGNHRKTSGLALLELSGIAIVLSAVLVFGLGYADAFGRALFVRRTVTKALESLSVQPLRAQVDTDGSVNFLVRHAELKENIEESLETALSDIRHEIESSPAQNDYRIEISYHVLAIDSRDGTVRGMVGNPSTYSLGALVPSLELNQRVSIAAALQDLIDDTSTVSGSLIAEPNGAFVLGDGSADRFIPLTIVFGARMFLSNRGSVASLLGTRGEISSAVKVIPSRGGVR